MGTVLNDYKKIYNESIKEYGERTVLLYQLGAFLEIYACDEKYTESNKWGNAKIISELLNIKYTGKLFGKNTFVNFIGFTISNLDKYLPILLSNDYTVVVVSEMESATSKKGTLKREITNIYSPTLQPIEYNTENILVGIFMNDTIISISAINNNTNEIELTELPNVNFDELNRVLSIYSPKEIQIINGNSEIVQQLKLHYGIVHEKTDLQKEYSDTNYQNEYFKKLYGNAILELDGVHLKSIVNLMYLIDFIAKHSITYTKNLGKPKIIKECNHLILELNTTQQLNLLHTTLGSKTRPKSLFDTIDYTKTAIGKRALRVLLSKPLKNAKDIKIRYQLTNDYSTIDTTFVNKSLSGLYDFEKMHRKMGIGSITPNDFTTLDKCYVLLYDLILYLEKTQLNIKLPDIVLFREYIDEYRHSFNLNDLVNVTKENVINYFNKGIVPELDIIGDQLENLEIQRNNLLDNYNKISGCENFVKFDYTDRDGFSFTCTKIRFNTLCGKLNDSIRKEIKTRTSTSQVKFYTDQLTRLSTNISNSKELLNQKIKLHFMNKMNNYYTKYNLQFESLKELIELIDITNSNFQCSLKNNYTCPELIESKTSFINIKQIRHPIIEALGNCYIPNDINLDSGLLLYGLNSSGKSTLLRALGICLVMAQCGLNVPCQSMQFSPFNNIICQVDMTDDLFSGKSSFIQEMLGLKKILAVCGPNTLVLSDELAKGSEHFSATAILASTLKYMNSTNTKYLFTTHLHSLIQLNLEKIQIKHLSVSIRNDLIIFDRLLKDGSGSELYGIEVCKSILDNNNFIKDAYEIRNKLSGDRVSVLSTKKSRYNSKKIVDACEICGSDKNLETDHITEQMTANESGFLQKGIHKNHLSNLCTLCKNCHLQKTLGNIKIYGYKDSTNGKFLDWVKISK